MYNLWLVIPCYNEQMVLLQTASLLKERMNSLITKGKISDNSRILFVNDCSTDGTWDEIQNLHKQDDLYTGISLSHNRGQQKALFAGLMIAKDFADIVISLDADLQDDINVLEEFIDQYEHGYEVVYGVRSSRHRDRPMKRATAHSFYKAMKILGVEVVYNHADYRLLSKRVLMALSEYRETNLYLRGIIPDIGFKSTTVPYERKERAAGKTKYSLGKMMGLAFDGITSFSVQPMRLLLFLGGFIFLSSLIAFVITFVQKVQGISSNLNILISSIFLLGGLQLMGIGMIGEYIGKILIETKQRPRYIIEETLIKEKDTVVKNK